MVFMEGFLREWYIQMECQRVAVENEDLHQKRNLVKINNKLIASKMIFHTLSNILSKRAWLKLKNETRSNQYDQLSNRSLSWGNFTCDFPKKHRKVHLRE